MCDARRISARGVSLGVQRHVLVRMAMGGSTLTAHRSAVPLIFRAGGDASRRAPAPPSIDRAGPSSAS
jgi:hypothetical protein